MKRLILLVLAIAVGMVAGGTGSASTPRLGTIVFSDDGGMLIALDLGASSPRYGSFTVVVPSTGTFSPVAVASLDLNGTRNLKVRYEGDVDLASADGSVRRLPARLHGEFLIDSGRGVATLDADGRTYRLNARGIPTEDVRRILPQVEAAFRSAAWRDLHALLAEDLREETTAAELGTLLDAQTRELGPIVELRRLTVSEPRYSPLGIAYVVVRYSVTRRPASGPSSSTYDLYFVHEAAAWRLWFSAPR